MPANMTLSAVATSSGQPSASNSLWPRRARRGALAALAAQAGVSRTTLAKRFAELVGEPPLTYLTRWRMTLAADMLAESTATVAAVARRLGYADPFGFSTAFKRIYGMSPSEHRQVGTMSRGSGANADGRGTMVGCIGS